MAKDMAKIKMVETMDHSGLDWMKSTKCDNSGPNCVEVAFFEDLTLVRDSANPGQVLVFDEGEWDAFVKGAQAGEFNLK